MGNIWETWWLIKGNRFIPNKNQTNPYKHRYGYSARNAETPHWLLGNIFQICKFPQIMWNQVESDLGLPGYRKMVVFMRTWPFKQMIKINMYIYISYVIYINDGILIVRILRQSQCLWSSALKPPAGIHTSSEICLLWVSKGPGILASQVFIASLQVGFKKLPRKTTGILLSDQDLGVYIYWSTHDVC